MRNFLNKTSRAKKAKQLINWDGWSIKHMCQRKHLLSHWGANNSVKKGFSAKHLSLSIRLTVQLGRFESYTLFGCRCWSKEFGIGFGRKNSSVWLSSEFRNGNGLNTMQAVFMTQAQTYSQYRAPLL